MSTKPKTPPTPSDRLLDWRQLLWYFIVPMALSGLMLAMYFSGNRLLENIVSAPYFEAVPPNSRREFGLLETLQHLMLLAVVAIAVRCAIIKPERIIKGFMLIVALGATVLFLEEIDYGIHYYEFLAGVPYDETAEWRNFHNVGNRTAMLKTIGTIAAVAWFGAGPFVLGQSRNRWARYFTPPPSMALLLIVMFITRTIAHDLHKRGLGYGLDGNISEFRELVIYYLGLAYTIVLARRTPDEATDAEAEPPLSD